MLLIHASSLFITEYSAFLSLLLTAEKCVCFFSYVKIDTLFYLSYFGRIGFLFMPNTLKDNVIAGLTVFAITSDHAGGMPTPWVH